MRNDSSATHGGLVPAPEPDDVRHTLEVAWTRDGSHAVVRVANHGDRVAVVTAWTGRRLAVTRFLQLLAPSQPCVEDTSFAAIAPGTSEDLAVPVARSHRSVVLEVRVTVGGHSEPTTWRLPALAA